MDIQDSFTIAAPKLKVWEQLLNLDVLSACVPGLESLTLESEDTYSGQITVKVGPIKAQYDGLVHFVKMDAPNHLEAEISGKDNSNSSNIKGSFISHLTAEKDGTRVDYSIKVLVRGKIAQFGMPVIQATTKKLAAQFGNCFQSKIQEMIQDE
jgi:carbon monoxide dehydrogenase subunit G